MFCTSAFDTYKQAKVESQIYSMISSTSTINRTKFLALPYFKTFNIIAYEYECTSKYLFSPDGSFKVSDLTLKLSGKWPRGESEKFHAQFEGAKVELLDQNRGR